MMNNKQDSNGDNVARAIKGIASALHSLGTGNAASSMGAIEYLAVSSKEGAADVAGAVRQLSEAADGIAAALDNIALAIEARRSGSGTP